MNQPTETTYPALTKFKQLCWIKKKQQSELALGQIHNVLAGEAGFRDYHDLHKAWENDTRLADYVSAQLKELNSEPTE